MTKFLIGLCCGAVIVGGLIHIAYLRKNKKALPEDQ